jgi:hypothetical protein
MIIGGTGSGIGSMTGASGSDGMPGISVGGSAGRGTGAGGSGIPGGAIEGGGSGDSPGGKPGGGAGTPLIAASAAKGRNRAAFASRDPREASSRRAISGGQP